ncbi:MAG: cyclic nucleotide-binding domain-containing protein [bacterium]|nr:cyclic nucleotide-binding domain-containing protein [bacterium]
MEIAEILKQTPIFSSLTRRDLRRLAKTARVRKYQTSQTIIREGRNPHGFFIIVSGKVEVVKDADTDHPSVLRIMEAGDFFGTAALIERKPRTATVRAIEDTECVSLWRVNFRAELKQNPEIAVKMLSSLLRRISRDESD